MGGPGQGAQAEVWQRRALENALPSFSFPRTARPLEEDPPAEEPVETGQHVSVDTGWACWESGGPSPREASDLAVWGYLRSHDDMA